MLERINVWPIAREHYDSSLRDTKTRAIRWQDVLLFVVFPILTGAAFTWLGLEASSEFTAVAGVAVSVLAGLLFQLVALLYSLVDKVTTTSDAVDPAIRNREWAEYRNRRIGLIQDAYTSTAYSILIALVILALLLGMSADAGERMLVLLPQKLPVVPWHTVVTFTHKVVQFFLVVFVVVFVLTLLMVLRRMHKLITDAIPRPVPLE